ncbi:hypothetical protein N7471_013007 [Penicillium samsonianum]|uniref:uncharacterized protein n=1 Tax=Penicillium samsonianum TaxID=1882272 RepID=UPI0025497F9D|nr:uncharacterized protein N7471_013007 [Penicillium samsonianum]KAJ6119056.1 hypothetical protein N7471_013007 [Penicillium samsonianum]
MAPLFAIAPALLFRLGNGLWRWLATLNLEDVSGKYLWTTIQNCHGTLWLLGQHKFLESIQDKQLSSLLQHWVRKLANFARTHRHPPSSSGLP